MLVFASENDNGGSRAPTSWAQVMIPTGSSQEKMIQVLEQIPTSMAMFDRVMRYCWASERWLSDYQLKPDAILGRSHYDIFPEITEEWKQVHQRCLAGAVERSDGEPFVRENGVVQFIRWEVRPWVDDQGSIGGILIFAEDIYTQDRAKKLISRVAHDLKNPIQSILLNVQILKRLDIRDRSAKATVRKIADRMARVAQQMSGLVKSVLRMSNVRESGPEVCRNVQSITPLLEAARESVSLLADEKGVRLELREQPDLPELSFDHDQLLEVLGNLLGNAVKFTPAGGSIFLESTADQDAVGFIVRDTGIGISAEDLPRIFERGFCGRNQTGEGQGLGLSIAREIVEAHGGRIWAESSPGQGSTFTFVIPREWTQAQ